MTDPEERTVGVDVGRLDVSGLLSMLPPDFHCDKASLPRQLQAIDFAGQSDYMSTHQLFLTARTLCLLVVDISVYQADHYNVAVQPWLDSLESRLGGCTDVMVLMLRCAVPYTMLGGVYPC